MTVKSAKILLYYKLVNHQIIDNKFFISKFQLGSFEMFNSDKLDSITNEYDTINETIIVKHLKTYKTNYA